MSTVPVKRIVNVTVNVAAAAPAAPTFSLGLCLGSSTKLPAYNRLRTYDDILGVGADFATTDEEYKFAQLYFAQSPKPDQLMIGRRLLAATAGALKSGIHSTTPATFTAVTHGGFDISINGTNHPISALDLHLAADLPGVAAVVQTALNTALTGTTCTYDGTNFVVTSPTTGSASSVGYAIAPSTVTTPAQTDLSVLLGLAASAEAVRIPGANVESVTDSLAALALQDGSWYGFHCTKEVGDTDLQAASVWGEAAGKFHFVTSSDAPILDPTATTDLASVLQGLQLTHTLLQYSSTNPYAAGSAMARGLQVDFAQINSTITLMFKQEPGVTPENLTATQYATLDAKKVNYLATVSNGFIMLFNGVTPSGRFFDEVMGLDWFQADMANNVFVALATSPTKVPQTDKGMVVLLQAASVTCETAVRNQLAAPGVWTHAGFGALKTNEQLPLGYYLYANPVSSQSDADRSARKAPPTQVALIGAGAFQGIDIAVNFQR
jgi:hypothetical protein